MITNSELDEMEKAESTPGPWQIKQNNALDWEVFAPCPCCGTVGHFPIRDDAEWVLSAKNNYQRLIDEVRELNKITTSPPKVKILWKNLSIDLMINFARGGCFALGLIIVLIIIGIVSGGVTWK